MRFYGAEVADVAAELVDAYGEVFSAPPWNEDAGAAKEYEVRLGADCLRPGFLTVVQARGDEGDEGDEGDAGDGADGADGTDRLGRVDRVDGFTSGWTTPDPFPADRSYWRVTAQLGSERVERLLVGAFQIDELAVRERVRRTGLGRRLLGAAVAAGAPDGRAWLLTQRSATATVAFYRRCGWHEVPPVPDAEGANIVVFLAPGHPGAEDAGATP